VVRCLNLFPFPRIGEVRCWSGEGRRLVAADFLQPTHVPFDIREAMAVATPRDDNWAKIMQWTPTGHADQVWALRRVDPPCDVICDRSYYLIVNAGSSKCLAMPNASRTAGTQAVQYSCNNGRDQKWYLERHS
jgi:hypothetical protein